MLRKVLIVTTCLAFSTLGRSADQLPRIDKKTGSVFLSPAMQSAVEKFNSKFKVWNISDYTPKVVSDDHQKQNPRKLPFALIIDVNKDGVLDAVLDGNDGQNSVLVGVVSEKGSYKVLKIYEQEMVDPKTIDNQFEGKSEKGLPYYLWLRDDDPDTEGLEVFTIAYPQQSDEKGELTNGGGFTTDYIFMEGQFVPVTEEL